MCRGAGNHEKFKTKAQQKVAFGDGGHRRRGSLNRTMGLTGGG